MLYLSVMLTIIALATLITLPSMMRKRCSECGARNGLEAKACQSCGAVFPEDD
jgi:ribosomal protein L40E